MGKPASRDEMLKQVKLIENYEKKREDLGVKTRENNKALATAGKKLQCMVTGEDAELFDGDAESAE